MSSSEVSDAVFIRQFLIILALLVIWTVASAFLGRGLAAKSLEEQLLSKEAVKMRIQPVGTVNTSAAALAPAEKATAAATSTPTSTPAPAPTAAPAPQPVPAPTAEKPTQVAAAGPSGEEVYQATCFACHGTGLPNVPKTGDAVAWEPRAAKGMAALMESTINGRGAMPPRAANPQLTDEEIEAAINYMLKETGVSAG